MTTGTCARPVGRLSAVGVLLAMATSLGGCASESWSNIKATGFNAYVDQLPKSCPNLRIGNEDIGRWLTRGASSESNYLIFFDNLSRLYSGKISRDEFRTSIDSLLGAGPHNEASYACMFKSLPAQPAA